MIGLGGSEVILSAQQEALTITGDAVYAITAGAGVDTIDGAAEAYEHDCCGRV